MRLRRRPAVLRRESGTPHATFLGPNRWVEREQFIRNRCKGKVVLHLGCLGETESPTADRVSFFLSKRSLHSQLLGLADEVVGLDIDSEAIGEIQTQANRTIHIGDVERLSESTIPDDFQPDLILAGDIIEHLSNPGAMLDGAASWLSPTAEFLLTTPNALGLPNYVRFLFRRYREGGDHVQTYSIFTLSNLLARHGYQVSESLTCWQRRSANEMQNSLRTRLLFKAASQLLRRVPRLGGTLLVVARRTADGPT